MPHLDAAAGVADAIGGYSRAMSPETAAV